MKRKGNIIVFVVLALLLISVISSEVSLQTVKGDPQTTLTVQLFNIGDGQTSLTSNLAHTSANVVKLMIPPTERQGSGCMALYPYNEPLSTLQSFQIYTFYTNATPRFVIQLDKNRDGMADIVLLSDYQFLGNNLWQLTQGGQRWGWTEASPDLSTFGINLESIQLLAMSLWKCNSSLSWSCIRVLGN